MGRWAAFAFVEYLHRNTVTLNTLHNKPMGEDPAQAVHGPLAALDLREEVELRRREKAPRTLADFQQELG